MDPKVSRPWVFMISLSALLLRADCQWTLVKYIPTATTGDIAAEKNVK